VPLSTASCTWSPGSALCSAAMESSAVGGRDRWAR
jgi:hypothetical protein